MFLIWASKPHPTPLTWFWGQGGVARWGQAEDLFQRKHENAQANQGAPAGRRDNPGFRPRKLSSHSPWVIWLQKVFSPSAFSSSQRLRTTLPDSSLFCPESPNLPDYQRGRFGTGRGRDQLTNWPVKRWPSCSTWICSRSSCSWLSRASRLWLTSLSSCDRVSDCSWIRRASRAKGAARFSSGGFKDRPAFCTSWAKKAGEKRGRRRRGPKPSFGVLIQIFLSPAQKRASAGSVQLTQHGNPAAGFVLYRQKGPRWIPASRGKNSAKIWRAEAKTLAGNVKLNLCFSNLATFSCKVFNSQNSYWRGKSTHLTLANFEKH